LILYRKEEKSRNRLLYWHLFPDGRWEIMSRIKDITNERFGKLVVLEATSDRKDNSVVWKC